MLPERIFKDALRGASDLFLEVRIKVYVDDKKSNVQSDTTGDAANTRTKKRMNVPNLKLSLSE